MSKFHPNPDQWKHIMHHKSSPHRIFLAANRRVWKAIRKGDYKAAAYWSQVAARQNAIECSSGKDTRDYQRDQLANEERKLRIAHAKKWPRGYR